MQIVLSWFQVQKNSWLKFFRNRFWFKMIQKDSNSRHSSINTVVLEMKCGLFNDPFDYYGHIGSGNGNRLHKLFWGKAVVLERVVQEHVVVKFVGKLNVMSKEARLRVFLNSFTVNIVKLLPQSQIGDDYIFWNNNKLESVQYFTHELELSRSWFLSCDWLTCSSIKDRKFEKVWFVKLCRSSSKNRR